MPRERAPQRVGIGTPAMRRDPLGRLVRLLETPPRRADAHRFDNAGKTGELPISASNRWDEEPYIVTLKSQRSLKLGSGGRSQ